MNNCAIVLFLCLASSLIKPKDVDSQPIDSNRASTVTVDLSYAFDSQTVYWPTARRFQHSVVWRNYTQAGFYYESNDFSASEHGGTHLDAPAHFCDPNGEVKCWRADEIPLSRFRGEGILVDVSSLASWPDHRDVLVTRNDLSTRLTAWEKWQGRAIPKGAFILVYTGWGKYYKDEEKYLGNSKRNASDLHFPSLHPDAATFLVEHPSLFSMVGVDTASIDFGPSTDFASHQILLGANIPGLENLANLDKLAAELGDAGGNNSNRKTIEIIALPMKIGDGSGAPVRVLAVVSNGSALFIHLSSLVKILSCLLTMLNSFYRH